MYTKLQSLLLPPLSGGQRICNAADFDLLKKFASHFFNYDFIGTGQKERLMSYE